MTTPSVRRRRHRPGHHLHAVPALRPLGPDGLGGPARAPPALPAARVGRARRRRDLAQHRPRGPRGAAPGRPHRRRRGRHRASPTSARPRWSGTARTGRRSPPRSPGRTPAPPTWSPSSRTRPRRRCSARSRPGAGGLLRRPAAALAARPHARACSERAERGEVLFGTMETWLIWNLTGGPDGGVHVTDVTNASRTMLMDVRTLQWDQRLLDALDDPGRDAARDPPQRARSTAPAPRCCPGVPIGGALGDQQAALFGQTCFDAGRGQVHLRHRRLPAAQHRHPARRVDPRPAARRSPTTCRARPPRLRRSRARSR